MAFDIRGRVVVITGGNAGIGQAAATTLSRAGARVVITSRDPEKGEAARRQIETPGGAPVACVPLDLASFDSIRTCAATLLERFSTLDILINNAGLILSARSETREGFETTLGVNHVGHFLLTELLLERIRASAPSRIVVVSSAAHRRAITGLDFSDLQSERHYRPFIVYARSKLANLYHARELARRLAESGVTVNAVHPGTVATRFALDGDTQGWLQQFYRFFSPFLLTPERGARPLIHAAASPELTGKTGLYLVRCRPVSPSRAGRNDAAARRLWELSEKWVAEGRP